MKTNKYTRRQFLKVTSALATLALATAYTPSLAWAINPESQGLSKQTKLLMGTTVTILVRGSSEEHRQQAMAEAFDNMEKGITIFDRHSSNSALGTLNKSGLLQDAPQSLLFVLEQAQSFGLASGHLFNPALLPALNLLAKHKTSHQHIAVDKQELAEALALANPLGIEVKGHNISLASAGMGITLDGIAKGYLADVAANALACSGFTDYMVDAGGDIRANGLNAQGSPWQIGITSPTHQNMTLASTALHNKGMATSGGYERFFDASKESNHLINPQTGKSPSLASVTVLAPTAMQADALATTVSFMTPKKAMAFVSAYKDSSCLIVGRAGEVYKSNSWLS